MIERLFTPRKNEHGPVARIMVERIRDSGGGWYRPPFRTQDPAVDPQEPYGSESQNTGNDHGWANCTMSAGAMVLAFHTLGGVDKWGGLLRHHQNDLTGGTDLYDLRDAWGAYGQVLDIRSGAGWSALTADREAGRAIVLQGEGGTPGAGTFTGGHAIAVLPESHSDGRWLIGNPECSGFEWVASTALREWAETWSSGIAYARSNPNPPGGSGGGDVALAVIDRREQLGDVAAGVDFYEAPGGERIGEMSKAFTGVHVVGVPMDKSSDGLNLGWRAVWISTQAVNGVMSDKIVYIPTDQITNLRAIPATPPPTGDCDDDIADAVEARDAEWIAHLTPD